MAAGGTPLRLRAVALLLLLAIGGLGVGARIAPAWSHVHPAGGEPRLLGVDSYFHLRHASHAARHFPHLKRWDAAVSFPRGERTNAAGLFDLALASAGLALGAGQASLETLLRVLAWAPLALFVVVLASLHALGRTLGGRGYALLACGLFVLYPGHSLGRTLLGFADHHAAEMALSLLCALAVHDVVARQRTSPPAPAWRPAFVGAAPLALFLFTWPGAPLYLAITALALLLPASWELARGGAIDAFAAAAFRIGTALALWVAGVALCLPDLVLNESLLAPLLVAIAGLALGLPAYLRACAAGARRGVAPAGCAAGGLLGLALAGLAAAARSPEAAQLSGLVLGTKSSLVDEQRRVDLAEFLFTLGPPGLLALAALPLGLAAAWRRRDAARTLPILVFGALVLALWWRTHDYEYVVPAFAALLATFSVSELARLGPAARRPRLAAAALALVLVLPVWPLGMVKRPWHGRGEVAHLVELNPGWEQALKFLREGTPEPPLPVGERVPAWEAGDLAHPPGSWGVLSAWEFGNLVAALGQRPAVRAGGFGDGSFAFYLAEDERSSRERLCPDCGPTERVRYVVTDARSLGDFFAGKVLHHEGSLARFTGSGGSVRHAGRELALATLGPAYERTMAFRLHLGDGDGLAHYRLVYESPHQSWLAYVGIPGEDGLQVRRRALPVDSPDHAALYASWLGTGVPTSTPLGWVYDGALASSVKVFEVVPGGVLAGAPGSAAPGAEVEATLVLRSRTTGRELRYARRARAGADGSFELVVPYPTTPTGTLEPQGPYRVATGAAGPVYHVDVAAAQVAAGERIDLGPKTLARSSSPHPVPSPDPPKLR